MMIEMEVREINMSDQLSTWSVVLEEKDGSRRFTIFIGPAEAVALDNAAHGRPSSRPMTHDLICNAIEGMGGELQGVYIHELRESVYYGRLIVKSADENLINIDSRPSDAMVLAVKKSVPIYVADEVFEAIGESSEDGGP
jgi:uncharacterized protein